MATLPCPWKHTDVSWKRYINGKLTTLASTKNGKLTIHDKRFALQADNSLVIMKVVLLDSGMFQCNSGQIYLDVTTDPKSVGSALVPNGKNADEESGDQTSPDVWKTVAGVAVGAVLALLSVITLILYLKRRGQRSQNQTVAEVIYEEVKHVEEEPLENPYVYIIGTADTPTVTVSDLYSKVNKPREECVYSLAQTSPQTGSLGSASHYHAVP